MGVRIASSLAACLILGAAPAVSRAEVSLSEIEMPTSGQARIDRSELRGVDSTVVKSPVVRRLLADTATYAGVAALGSALIPAGQPAALVLGGIAAAATGLEIGLFSDDPVVDTIAAIGSMAVRHKNPLVEDGAQRLVDTLIRTGGRELRSQMRGNNVGRNQETRPGAACTPENPLGKREVYVTNGSGGGGGVSR